MPDGDEYPSNWKTRLFDKLDAADKEHQDLKLEVALMKQKQGQMWSIFIFIGIALGGLIMDRLKDVL